MKYDRIVATIINCGYEIITRSRKVELLISRKDALRLFGVTLVVPSMYMRRSAWNGRCRKDVVPVVTY
eukprot:3659064-Pyramimonas_sp.AAC.1